MKGNEMTDEQRAMYEDLGPYQVLSGLFSLLLMKRSKKYNQMIVTVTPGASMNYDDIWPAIEYLQTALTNDQTHELIEALASASFDVMYPEQK
jgi:hypothetical protein